MSTENPTPTSESPSTNEASSGSSEPAGTSLPTAAPHAEPPKGSPSDAVSAPKSSPAPAGTAAGSDESDNGSSSSSPEGADAGDGAHEHGGHEGGDASHAGGEGGGAPGQAKKRRRRRRRKGGLGSTQPGSPVHAGALGSSPAEGAATAQGEPTVAPEHAGPVGGPDVAGEARPGEATDGRDGKRRRKRDRDRPGKPHDKPFDRRDLRERPAFGVGDVVFGKIVEITDEAILIDLSGKAKAIFDRREMSLPDEPADGPDPEREAAERAEAELEDKPTAPGADAEAANGSGDAAAAHAVTTTEGSPSAEGAAGPEHTAEPAADAGHAGGDDANSAAPKPSRRIIVAAGAKAAVDAPTDAGIAPSSPPDETGTGLDLAEEVPTVALVAAEPALTEPAPAPRPAPYAPPIVLELGAHFVGLVHNDGARGGLLVLTRHPHRVSRAKIAAVKAFKDKTIISGLVTGVVKGGVEVDVDGLRAFAPGSHMDVRLGADLHHFIAQRLDFLVTQYGKRGRDVVLSRRPMIEAEARANREAALHRLIPGNIVDGFVRSVVSFGAFIDVGGVEGLVPLPEMSHNRADTPSDVFTVGEPVTVQVQRIDAKGKVWLSRKAVMPDPWAEVAKKYAFGTRHTGKVVRLQPFGAFIELETGVDGLIHLGDLSIKRIEHPSEVVKIGDDIEVVVSSVDEGSHKIALHPVPTGAAADETPQRVMLHKPVKCAVVAVEAGGLVVRLLGVTGRNARGFITAAATGTPRGTELRKPFPVGTQLDAKVMELDPKRGEVKLSIKALREDTERNAYQQYRQQVNREAKFGTFADLLAKKNPPQK
jgi:small subunit ribosomal protein S1